MKSLATLIKMHRHTLDEMRKNLMGLQTKQLSIREYLKQLEKEMAKERHVATEDPVLQSSFVHYVKVALERKQMLHQLLDKTEAQLQTLQENLQVQYAQTKAYETLYEQKKQAERHRIEKQEQAALDEAGTQQYMQRQETME